MLPLANVLQNRCSLKFGNIYEKTPVLEPHFNKVHYSLLKRISLIKFLATLLKSGSDTGFPFERCKFFKNSFFHRTPPMTAFISTQKGSEESMEQRSEEKFFK